MSSPGEPFATPCSEEEYEEGKRTRLMPLHLKVGEEYFLRRKSDLWQHLRLGSFATDQLVEVTGKVRDNSLQIQIQFQEYQSASPSLIYDLLLCDTEGWLYRDSIKGEPIGYFLSVADEADPDWATPTSRAKRRPLVPA